MKAPLLRRGPGGRRRVAGILAGVAAVTFMVAPATAANAATPSTSVPTGASAAAVQPMSSFADCPPSDLCWWVDWREQGKMHPVKDAIANWSTQKEPTCGNGNWNDCASTLYNNRVGYGAQVYANAYPQGGSPPSSDPGFCLVPGSQVGYVLAAVFYSNNNNMVLDDTISANRWRSGGC